MSGPPAIVSVGCASPAFTVAQAEARTFARGFFAEDHPGLERLLPAFERAGVRARQLVKPLPWYHVPHTFSEKNAVYLDEAVPLAICAARRALEGARMVPSDIGTIVFVSSTGIATPSLDSRLVPVLGLSRSVARVPLWGLGCAGGAAGLARARELACGTGRPVLLVAVELCSATFMHGDRSKSNLIATALFGDGAAAAIIVPRGEGLSLLGSHGTLLDDTQDVMGWHVDDEGLRVRFAKSIPGIVKDVVPPLLRDLATGLGVERDAFEHFLVHPGGAKVLAAYEDALGVPRASLERSWSVLADHGNMSSVTVLFVIQRFMRTETRRGRLGVVLGLGPGFCAEAVGVRW